MTKRTESMKHSLFFFDGIIGVAKTNGTVAFSCGRRGTAVAVDEE